MTGDQHHTNTSIATTGYWTHASTTGNWAHASTAGRSAHAVALSGAAEAADGVAVGKFVKFAPGRSAVVLPPTPEYLPVVISEADGWTPDVWTFFETHNRQWVVTQDHNLLLPNDGRGHTVQHKDGRYIAGCRNFTYAQAVKHWSNPGHASPDCARRILDAITAHHAAYHEGTS